MRASESGIKQWTKNLVTSGLSDELSWEILRKVLMLNIISFVAIAMLIPLGILAFVQGHPAVGFFDLGVAIVLIVTVLYLRRSGRDDVASYVGISVAGTLFLFLFVTGGPSNTGFL